MTCPSNENIDEFVDGELVGAGLVAMEGHMDACISCREVVSALTKLRQDLLESQDYVDNVAWPVPERYELSHLLGRGGMGAVFLAEDRKLRRKIALKMMRPQRYGDEGDTSALERFIREAQNMAQVSHPNVVTVHDYGHHEGHAYIAMEFIDCLSLREWLAEGERDCHAVTEVMMQAGEGLAAAHEAGLIHRDLKPDNVLVGRDGRVRISDFGLSRGGEYGGESASGDPTMRLTRTGMLLGTPLYMAPEQHFGGRGDELSDQYAFCASFYEALVGRPPFDADSHSAIAAEKLSGRFAPLSGSIPRNLRSAIEMGLEADAEKRHPSVRALLEACARPRRGGRRYLPVVVGAVVVAGAALLALAPWAPEPRTGASLTSHEDAAPVVQLVVALDSAVPTATVDANGESADGGGIHKGRETARAPRGRELVRKTASGADAGSNVGADAGGDVSASVSSDAGLEDAGLEDGSLPAQHPPSARPLDVSPEPGSVNAVATMDLRGKGIQWSERFISCVYCDVSDAGEHLLLRFQQGRGHTIWSIYLARNSVAGTKPLGGSGARRGHRLSVSLSSPALPAEVRGHFGLVASESTLTLLAVDEGPGGEIVGRIDAHLSRPDGGVALHLVASFRARIPR